MAAQILDGKSLAAAVRLAVKESVSRLAQRGIKPGLAVILAGDDPASRVYVRHKTLACEETGVQSRVLTFDRSVSQNQLVETVEALNADAAIHGILVQLPLPRQVSSQRVLQRIAPAKDVDGFHPENVGKVFVGDPSGFRPATPYGVQQLLLRSGVETTGAHAVIVGRSNIVGRPMAALLLQDGPGGNATVTVCHSRTRDIASVTRSADILIVAMGKPEFVTGAMIRRGAVVIDVGVNRVVDPATRTGYRLVGDVNFAEGAEVAAAITPVPGGVGPMTITMLLYNTVESAKRRAAQNRAKG